MKQQLYIILTAAVFFTGCGDSFYQAQNYLTGPVDGVGLKSSTTIVEGGVEQLFAVVTPSKTENKNVAWTSSDSSVAEVDSTGTVTGLKVGSAVITVTTEEGRFTAVCDVTIALKPIPVTGITISKISSAMLIGGTEQLTVEIFPAEATNQNLTWSSEDSGIASVDASGLVTGRTSGSTRITATTSDGNLKQSCVFFVSSVPVDVTAMNLNKSATFIRTGKSERLFAMISPANATNQNVQWTSSDNSIATVDSLGLVKGLSGGTVSITAKTFSGGFTKTATCMISSAEIPVTGLSIDATSLILTSGSTGQLAVEIIPADATDQNLKWVSSNTGVVSVNSSGLVTGISPGNAEVTVTSLDGGKTASCNVIVNAGVVPVTGLTLNKATTSIAKGESEKLFATVFPVLATNKKVSWSTSNGLVAAVSNSGNVTGISAGSATITAVTEDGGKTASCLCEVPAGPVAVTGLALLPATLSINKGVSFKLTATITPSNATNQGISWSSSNISAATVDDNGIVTGIAGGNAVISASVSGGSIVKTCSVTVPVPVEGVEIHYSGAKVTELTLDDGLTRGLTAVVLPAGATNSEVSWSSVNYSFATVTPSGLVTPLSSGTVAIKVTTADGGYTAYCLLNITDFSVTYNANGAVSGDVPDTTYSIAGRKVTVQGNTGALAKSGSFIGWNTAADGSGTNYTAGQTFTITGNTTLYAKWHTSYYSAGQDGPAGGLIIYDKGSYSNGWQYIEASKTDENGGANSMWDPNGSSASSTGADGIILGTGLENTNIMITKKYGDIYKLFENITKGGYSDWFLPSKDELIQMRSYYVLLGSPINQYWSSSEVSANPAGKAWSVQISSVFEAEQYKSGGCKVRAARRF